MHSSLEHLEHRPWALPEKRWAWRQSWYDLGFIHYRISAISIRDKIPPELEIDEFDGTAWISIVPFRMHDVMYRNLPSVYPLRSFPELNVRTYVTSNNKSGVWFFSLDADCWPIVIGGKSLYGLPYFKAKMSLNKSGDHYRIISKRTSAHTEFDAVYETNGNVLETKKDSFEQWVTERYCLYSAKRNKSVVRLEVHHKQWPLQLAQVEMRKNDLLKQAGLDIHNESPICHFSSGVDVVSYHPEFLSH